MRGSRGHEADSKIEHFLSEAEKVRGSRGHEVDSKIEHFLSEAKKVRGKGFEPLNS